MKKFLTFTILAGFLAVLSAQEPVVMTINGKPVGQGEFEYIWKKNAANNVEDDLSFDDYVDMFVVFKLKVAEAEAAGLDTTASFISELKGYRSQLTPPYLTDAQAEQALLREAYDMTRTYVDLGHILIALPTDARPADTLKAFQKAMELHHRILAKGGDFARIAREESEESSAQNDGLLGTTVASRYIIPFARTAMSLDKGQVSLPFRSRFGYHIIKLYDKFEVPGQYASGHILKMLGPASTDEERQAARNEILDIYTQLQAGTPFETIAGSARNDDNYVREREGRYEPLRAGSLPYDYEKNVFALKDGAYSQPFQTSYGWHIVKRYAVLPHPTQAELEKELKTAVSRDQRAQEGKKSLSRKLQQQYHLSINKPALAAFIEKASAHPTVDESLKAEIQSLSTLAVCDGFRLTADDFLSFLSEKASRQNDLCAAWEELLDERILRYEDSRLEVKYPDFGHLMQEYHDGILLFEISNRDVWEKGANDLQGQAAYFKAHRKSYTWEAPRFKGAVISCTNAPLAAQVRKTVKKLPADSIGAVLNRLYNRDSIQVKVVQGLFAQGDNPTIDQVVFHTGSWTPEAKYPVVLKNGKTLKAPEEAADIKGQVITDYQNELEQKWVEALRKKYPVVLYHETLNKLRP
ncbi:MAG: peptidylprolyl isomerase [Bacteroidales bacterium]|nr:peptidylprolyl isomerase [Bacteroidales bacterium]